MQLYIKKLIIGLSMIFMPASMLNATELLNKTNITEIEGTQTYYTIAVPENSTALKVRLSNVTGDPDLYVRYGEQPTNEIFDCRPYSGQNTDETCNMDNPQAGTWYIMIDAYHDFSGANLIAEVDVILPSSPSSLSVEASANGYLTVTGTADPRTGVKATFPDQSVAYDTAAADGSFSIVSLHPQESGTISLVAIDLPGNSSTVSTIAYVKHAAPPAGSLNIPNITETHGTQKYYTIDVPANSTALNVLLSNITGDPDLYVRYGEKPTKQAYDCRPYESPNTDETCNMDNPQAGTWHIMIDAYKDFSGATLTATVEGGGTSLAVGYLPLWVMTPDKVKNIDSLYTHVLISFAKPNIEFNSNAIAWSTEKTGIQIVSGYTMDDYADAFAFLQNRGVKVLLAVGGATYSTPDYDSQWSKLANEYDTAIENTTYKKSLRNLIEHLNLDGIDIDYERVMDNNVTSELIDEYSKVILSFKDIVGDRLLTIAAGSVGAECSKVGELGCTKKSPFGWRPGLERAVFQKLEDDNNGYNHIEDIFNHVSIMTYDAFNHDNGTDIYDPIKIYESYREIYNGPLAMGLNPAPEGYGIGELVKTNIEAQNCINTSMIKAYSSDSNQSDKPYSLERFINYLKSKSKSGIMVWSLSDKSTDSGRPIECQYAVNLGGLNTYINNNMTD